MENGKRRTRRQLTPEEKWEVFLEVTSQELSQADAARKCRLPSRVLLGSWCLLGEGDDRAQGCAITTLPKGLAVS
jgi:transposase-like protein